ncbi:putative chymopapain protein [Helianthus anomalus]
MKIKKIILLSLSLALILGIVESFEFDDEELKSEEGMQRMYDRWRNHHNVHLEVSEDEKAERFNVFKTNVQHVHRTNKMNKPYKLKLNKFATMTNHEFTSTYASSKLKHYRALRGPHKSILNRKSNLNFTYEKVANIPPAIDWRTRNAVTPPKDQGKCGGCWAFSTVVSIEGINAIKTGELVSLSEQQLIDCADGLNQGCSGGIMEPAFIFIQEHGGITTEKNYPWTFKDGICDPAKIRHPLITIDGFEDVPECNEEALMKAVANQPISAAVEANGHDFQFYYQGVFTGQCGVDVNHAIAIVGYGETPEGMKYWIVKNSWGPDWGEGGYIRVQRGVPDPMGLCGINVQASYPVAYGGVAIRHTSCEAEEKMDKLERHTLLPKHNILVNS